MTDKVTMTKEEPAKEPPNIFRAAMNDDVRELALALQDGQSLSDQDPERLLMTPLHIAASVGSNTFLREASSHDSFDPWIRDANLRRPVEHASAYRNGEGHKILTAAMYADLFEPDGGTVDFPGDSPEP